MMLKDATQITELAIYPAYRRLQDAVSQWHTALEKYFEPDEFRIALQGCIQTTRSVTFILQSNKSKIEKFDDWYSGWQEKMKSDFVMKWLIDARNTIEKQGDLEGYSEINATITAYYYDEIEPKIKLKADLEEGLPIILENISYKSLPEHYKENGTLIVERRWVASSLKNYEVLDALLHCHRFLWDIVVDACDLLKVELDGFINPVPLMIGHHRNRSISFSLKDRSVTSWNFSTESIDKNIVADGRRRYEIDDTSSQDFPDNPSSLQEISKALHNQSKKMFLKDGYANPVVFLIKDLQVLMPVQYPALSREDKYTFFRELAYEFKRHQADALVMIHEVWLSLKKVEPPLLYVSDMPEKQEYLMAVQFSKEDTNPGGWFAEIIREEENISLTESAWRSDGTAHIFEPIRKLWGSN